MMAATMLTLSPMLILMQTVTITIVSSARYRKFPVQKDDLTTLFASTPNLKDEQTLAELVALAFKSMPMGFRTQMLSGLAQYTSSNDEFNEKFGHLVLFLLDDHTRTRLLDHLTKIGEGQSCYEAFKKALEAVPAPSAVVTTGAATLPDSDGSIVVQQHGERRQPVALENDLGNQVHSSSELTNVPATVDNDSADGTVSSLGGTNNSTSTDTDTARSNVTETTTMTANDGARRGGGVGGGEETAKAPE